ncbi:putative B3 domain-containing protein Os03g0621600 [Miscanthus floridulus]|uniref:putative B3 domain-containing protein Os03g0621600 n=1 Tax=Miscanthus floridulus TaxID=154761 RepID=UPI0034595A12
MRNPSKDANYHRDDHTCDHGKHFFKVLIGDFHKKLVIPGKFAKHLGDKTEGSITLETLGGYTFNVQVAKNLSKLVLQSGWESFVSAHDLKKMDFLVFKYDGMSRMKVLIFDPSGCEKVPPCVVAKNAISGGRKIKEPIDISSSCAHLLKKTAGTKKKAWKQRDWCRISTSSSRSLSNSSGGMTSSEGDEAHSVPSYMLPRGTSLDSMQKKKLKERIRAICSKIPIYVCVVKKSNISGKSRAVVFSKKYSDVWLPFKSRRMILQCHGMSWEVMCHIMVGKDRGECKRLRNGWARFAGDNNLQLGDICLFEQLKTKKYKMNVHIIRKE